MAYEGARESLFRTLIAEFVASQMPAVAVPVTLPESGGSSLALNLALALLLSGGGLVVLGFSLKQFANRI